jgi:hypothetical protein
LRVADDKVFRAGRSSAEIAECLNKDGFVCLENAISANWLESARKDVDSLLSLHGNADFSLVDVGADSDLAASRLVNDNEVTGLLRDLAVAACPRPVDSRETPLGVLRVMVGSAKRGNSYHCHYDRHAVTMIVPVVIPDGEVGKTGELVVFPNRRPFRRSVTVNMAEKLLAQNPYSNRKMMTAATRKHRVQPKQLRPGNAYLLWGYRSLHGNMPCAEGLVRSTLAIHFANPHGHHPALSLMTRLRRTFVWDTDVAHRRDLERR